MTHPEHAEKVGAKGCNAATMGGRTCLNCGWELFPPAAPVSWWGEGYKPGYSKDRVEAK